MYPSFLQETWAMQLITLGIIFALRAFILAGGSSVWIKFSGWAKRRTIVGEGPDSDIWSDIGHGMIILVMDSAGTVLAIKTGLMKFYIGPSVVGFFTAFALFFVWMEVYFYYSHRLLHTPRFYWIHKHHHHSRATNPWTSLSFSVAERSILLFGAIVIPCLVSQFIPFSLEAYSAYFLFNYVLNVYGHMNVETLPHGFVRSWPGKIIFTTTFHALHHARYRGHYGLFTQVLDRLHGTRFPDYETVHLKAVSTGPGAAVPLRVP